MINKNGKFLLSQWSNNNDRAYMYNVTNARTEAIYRPYFVDNSRVYLGNGTTQPDVEDVDLDARIASGLKLTAQGHSFPSEYADGYIMTTTSTWLNTSSNPITVRELGLVCASPTSLYTDMGVNTDYYNFDGKAYMIARELITPVTIEPGETYAFTMVIG